MKKKLIAVPALAIAALALSGCSALNNLMGPSQPDRDDSGQVTEQQESADVFSITVGDCIIEDSGSAETSETKVVPCSEPHLDEAYHAFDLPDGDYPGEEAVNTAADEGCYAEFENYVGFPYEESEIDFWSFRPSQGSWEQGGDREVVCFATPVDQELFTGTLKGAGR